MLFLYCNYLDEQNTIEHGEDRCKSRYEACNSLHCPYGITRTYDHDQCERCECENPCRNHQCRHDEQCAVDLHSDSQSGSAFVAVCRRRNYLK